MTLIKYSAKFTLAIFFISISLFSEPKTVKLGVYNWEPYISFEQKNHGILTEIAVKAFERMGYKVNLKSYPFPRIMHNLKDGRIDAAPAISKNEERNIYVDFSSPVYDLEQGFIFKKGKISYSSPSDLKNFKGGIMRNTFWMNKLKSLGIKFQEVTTQEYNIRKLAEDRVDFVCMPKDVAFHLMKKMGIDNKKYEFKALFTEKQYIGISKKTKFEDLLKDFEKGLMLIKRKNADNKVPSEEKQ